MAIIIPYIAMTLGLTLVLLRYRWDGRVRLVLPFAMGMAPTFASWIVEIYLYLNPGPGQNLILSVLIALVSVALLIIGRKEVPRIIPKCGASWSVIVMSAVLLLLFFQAAGPSIMQGWDPVAYSLLGERIAEEGIVDPVSLVLTPTIGGLNFVHAFHGVRYPIFLAFDDIFGMSNSVGWDVFPSLWFLLAGTLLAGGFAARDKVGWRGAGPWAVAALILSTPAFLHWPFAGKEGAVFTAFSCLAVLLASHLAADPQNSPEQYRVRWIVAGLALGLSIGHHRTMLIVPLIPLLYGVAAGAFQGNHHALKWGLAGAGASLVGFLPFGLVNQLKIGSLSVANPVSDALVPYRETWRSVFEAHPIPLAYEQFWQYSSGAVVWNGALLTALYLLVRGIRQNCWRASQMPRYWAFGISIALIAVMTSDMLLIWYATGESELILRSPKYRQMVVPILAVVTFWGLRTAAGDFGAKLEQGGRQGLSAVMRWTSPALPPLAALGVVTLFTATMYYKSPNVWPGSFAALETSARRLFGQSATDTLFELYPDARKVVENQDRVFGSKDHGGVIVDWMPIVSHLDRPLRNYWLQPGLFPLLEATSPSEAWKVLKDEQIAALILRLPRMGMELYSSTGIRHAWALEATELSYDGSFIDVFRRRGEPPPDIETIEYGRWISDEAQAVMAGGTPKASRIDLTAEPLTDAGDYELGLDISNTSGSLQIYVRDAASRKVKQWASIRAWKPYSPGPQRIRFAIMEGEALAVEVIPRGGFQWQDLHGAVLRRSSLNEALLR